jgi:3-(3-hydroxy-phenyl)propionate hydroxylase
LLDDLAGTGFRIVTREREHAEAALGPARRLHASVIRMAPEAPVLRRDADGVLSVTETDGVLAGWFARHDCATAIVRPDHYVYGVAATAEQVRGRLDTLAAELTRGRGGMEEGSPCQ